MYNNVHSGDDEEVIRLDTFFLKFISVSSASFLRDEETVPFSMVPFFLIHFDEEGFLIAWQLKMSGVSQKD